MEERHRPTQPELDGIAEKTDIAAVVAKTVDLVTDRMIDIPCIRVVPKGGARAEFKPFTLKLDAMKYPPVSDELWVQYLRTGGTETVAMLRGGSDEKRLEDYVVNGLAEFDDVAYDEHADLLYDFAAQTVKHFLFYLSEADAGKVLRCYQRDIARAIHAQMLEHFREDAAGYEVKVSKGFTELKGSAYTQKAEQPLADYRVSPPDLGKIEQYLFGPFKRCLFHVQKFDSDPERRLAVILERDALKWIRPAKGQIEMEYRQGAEHLEYVPDFVAETDEMKLMLETKAKNEMADADVVAKKEVAVTWCKNASAHAATYGGKQWRYALIPDTAIADNMTLKGLVQKYRA